MVDRNLQNFYGRLGRIERIHDSGGGFEAEGTLGMSYYNKHRRRTRVGRRGWLAPLVLIVCTVVAIKALVHSVVGPETYSERVAALQSGTEIEKFAAYVLQADPLTVGLSSQIRQFTR
ncbi:MAG: hypothetical protein R3E44_11395 [Paracoccaceae bacterium]